MIKILIVYSVSTLSRDTQALSVARQVNGKKVGSQALEKHVKGMWPIACVKMIGTSSGNNSPQYLFPG